MGGAAGCSPARRGPAAVRRTLAELAPAPAATADAVHRQLLRRDLVFDGNEAADGRLLVGVQQGDLRRAGGPGARPMGASGATTSSGCGSRSTAGRR
ncbi:MAG: hypothetical protein U0802_24060 [Candidatus Binatia bacterium]